ncbi:MAG TPA: YCF48-related protein [Vicinamibacterales bacterium]|nr:YCF48-related protein [Vicinamibacterales bacterium]
MAAPQHRLRTNIRFLLPPLVLGLVTLQAGTAAAQERWVQRGPEGGQIRTLAVDPQTPTTVYAGTGAGGVFRSVDGGASWAAMNLGLTDGNVPVLAIDPHTPSTLYAGTALSGVFRSVNGGATWDHTGLSSVSVASFAIDPQTTSSVYAGTTTGGVFHSPDGGASWSAVNAGLTNLYVTALAIDAQTPSILYAGTSGHGVFRSVDSGASWTPIVNGLAGFVVVSLVIDPQTSSTLYVATSDGGVFRTVDSGATWTDANGGLPMPLATRTLGIDPQTPSTIYVTDAAGRGVFRSTDSATSWGSVSTGLPTVEVLTLAVDPQSPGTLYAGTYRNGVYRSADAGSSWASANSRLTSHLVNAVVIDPVTPNTIYAGTFFGVFRSADAGVSWSDALSPWSATSLAIDPQTPSNLYAGTFGGAYRSADAGANWTLMNIGGMISPIVWRLVVDPHTPSTIYAGTSLGVHRSLDSGTTWTPVSSGLTSVDVRSLALDPQNSSIIYAGTTNGVFRSGDQGASWQFASAGLADPFVRFLAIDPQSPATLYAATSSGVFRSVDSGASWAAANVGLGETSLDVRALAVDPATPARVYAAVLHDGVYRSGDGGGSWSAFNTNLSQFGLDVLSLAIDPVTPSLVYAGTSGSSTLRWTQTPTISAIQPGFILRGVATSVSLTGTSFLSGSTTFAPMAGIAVSNVQVVSPTSVTATLTIDAGATLGARSAIVTTPHGSSNSVPFTVADPFPDLLLSSSHGGFAEGFAESYTLTVSNVGTAATTAPVTVTDTLPQGLSFASFAGADWACSAAGQIVTCVRSVPLGVNESSSVTVTVSVGSTPATLDHQVAVDTAGDLNAGNNAVSRPLSVSPTPTARLDITPSPVVAGEQALAAVTLSTPFPHDVFGTLTLGFTSSAASPGDDPAIQFSSGGRQVSFVIPANTLEARFAGSVDAGPVGFQTGTLAGVLTFAGTLVAGNVTSTLSPSGDVASLTIPERAPTVHGVETRTEGGFAARILLSSTVREVTAVILTFTTTKSIQLSCGDVAGCSVSGTTMTLNVESLFNDWFASNTSFGSLSLLRLPLAIDGAIQGTVSVRLRNSRGTSNAMSFTLP